MSMQPISATTPESGGPDRSDRLEQPGVQKITGKLLATQGYVIGIEISGSGSHQSVALADLQGQILHKVRHPLDYVPDTQTVLDMVDDMLSQVIAPEKLQDGRILRVGVAVGGL